MDQLISTIIGFGLPILGNALGGPLGGAAASLIAKALGASSAAPSDILASLQTTDRDIAIQKLKSAEAEYVASVQSEATIQSEQLKQTGLTMRTELGVDVGDGWFGRIVRAMQISWRPALAWQTLFECTAGGFLALNELWTGDTATVDNILKFQTFLIFYFSAKFAVMGVYVAGRSYEKPADANTNSGAIPQWAQILINSLKVKR